MTSKAQRARDMAAAGATVPAIGVALGMKWTDVRRAISKRPPGGSRRPVPALAGAVFGRLTAVRLSGGTGVADRKWLCICACGESREVLEQNLINKYSSSCGCLARDINRARMTTHGKSRDQQFRTEYGTWRRMLSRCDDIHNISYANYGGRGIQVCKRWRGSFENFLRDMGPRPGAGYSLDRIDNDGNYEPSNCRWATQKQQCRNTRVNRRLTIDGVTRLAVEWAAIADVHQSAINNRLSRGWSVRDAVFGKKGRRHGAL